MTSRLPRREFLRRAPLVTAASIAAWSARHDLATAAPRVTSPNDRIRFGLIGCGSLGNGHHLPNIHGRSDFEVLAVCDPDQDHADDARARTGGRAKTYKDFRDVLDRDDIDAVMIVTPDHWHGLISVAACEAGKDVYCEKPLSLAIDQGRAMSDAARRYGRVFQTGSQQRSSHDFHWACDLVRNGRIGQVTRIQASIGRSPTSDWTPDEAPPPNLDWDLWLGPAPDVPYNKQRCHYTFRWFYDYSGGKMTDWGAHHLDIAQWALGMSESGPVEVEATSERQTSGMFETAVAFDVHYKYKNGVVLHCTSKGENGVTFEGSEGSIFVSRSRIAADPPEILDQPVNAGEERLYESRNHWSNWADCIRERRRPICDVEIGHRSATVCHLGNLAIQLGRKLRWNPDTERFLDDDEANRLISRPMRGPWSL